MAQQAPAQVDVAQSEPLMGGYHRTEAYQHTGATLR